MMVLPNKVFYDNNDVVQRDLYLKSRDKEGNSGGSGDDIHTDASGVACDYCLAKKMKRLLKKKETICCCVVCRIDVVSSSQS